MKASKPSFRPLTPIGIDNILHFLKQHDRYARPTVSCVLHVTKPTEALRRSCSFQSFGDVYECWRTNPR